MVPSPSILVASFDIGRKNFAFCVEEIPLEEFDVLCALDNIVPNERFLKDGTHTPSFRKLVHRVCLTGNIILLENVNLTATLLAKDYEKVTPQLLQAMTACLNGYKSFWDRCSAFVIEQQMSFGARKNNTIAMRLAQHCMSYFLFHYGSFKQVIEFPAYHKTRILGAPHHISQYDRKKWSIEKALDILMHRKDTTFIDNINTRKKRDDVCDCITMLQSFKYHAFVDKAI